LGATVAFSGGLPSAGSSVEIGLRPQHLRVTEGNTHRVEMTEALGGVSFIHVSAETGEKLVIEAKGDVTPAIGSRIGIVFDAKDALFFDADGKRLR
jgi:lactose/L-arabinose transport system ATP-binding protein